jgi:flavin-dependent dehydrogenase
MTRFDVIVAGAGPVGLAAAIEAAGRGLSVALVEPRNGPVDKACGEGLMPGAVAALARLGVRPAGMPFRGIAYVDPSHEARHAFRAGPGLGVRRTTLHAALAERAAELGVLRVESRVGDVHQDGDSVHAAGLTASWLLACDGLHSVVRRGLGLDPRPAAAGRRRFGQRRHLATAPWSDYVEVHWSPLAEAYVTPVAPDLVGVAVLGRSGASYADLLAQVPSLRERLDALGVAGGSGPPWATAVQGAGPLRQPVRRRVAGRVLLVGDAAGYVDALTGEGIRTGLACARAAVEAVVAANPTAYERDWRQLTRSYRVLTNGLLAASRPQLARRSIVGGAARLPRVFGAAVEGLAG